MSEINCLSQKQNAQNAKLYIDEAGAEVGQALMLESGLLRFSKPQKCLLKLIRKPF